MLIYSRQRTKSWSHLTLSPDNPRYLTRSTAKISKSLTDLLEVWFFESKNKLAQRIVTPKETRKRHLAAAIYLHEGRKPPKSPEWCLPYGKFWKEINEQCITVIKRPKIWWYLGSTYQCELCIYCSVLKIFNFHQVLIF